jgi:hypothetical protein
MKVEMLLIDNIPELLVHILLFIPGYATSRNFVLALGTFSLWETWEKKRKLGFCYEIFQDDLGLTIKGIRSEWTYNEGDYWFLLTSKTKFKGKKKVVTSMLSGAMTSKKKAGFLVSRRHNVQAFKEEITENGIVKTIDRPKGTYVLITTRKGNLYVGPQYIFGYEVVFSSEGSLLSLTFESTNLRFKEYGVVKVNNKNHKFDLVHGYRYWGDELKKKDLSSFFEEIYDHLQTISEVMKEYEPLCNQLLSELKEKGIVKRK